MKALGILKTDEGEYVIRRKTRGSLVKRPNGKPVEIVAEGRDDWIGWVELKEETVNEMAIRNTGRVIAEVKADILAVVEAEDRIALERFDAEILKEQASPISRSC